MRVFFSIHIQRMLDTCGSSFANRKYPQGFYAYFFAKGTGIAAKHLKWVMYFKKIGEIYFLSFSIRCYSTCMKYCKRFSGHVTTELKIKSNNPETQINFTWLLRVFHEKPDWRAFPDFYGKFVFHSCTGVLVFLKLVHLIWRTKCPIFQPNNHCITAIVCWICSLELEGFNFKIRISTCVHVWECILKSYSFGYLFIHFLSFRESLKFKLLL